MKMIKGQMNITINMTKGQCLFLGFCASFLQNVTIHKKYPKMMVVRNLLAQSGMWKSKQNTYLVETHFHCCGVSWWILSSDWACSVPKRAQRSAACRPRREWQATASGDCVWPHPNCTAWVPHNPAWSWKSHQGHKRKSCGQEIELY